VTDAISPISSVTVYNNCFNFNGVSNPTYDRQNPFCQLIRRNPVTGDREEVDALYSNLGLIETQGADLTVSWNKDIGPGALGLQGTFTYLDYFRYQPDPNAALNDATGTVGIGTPVTALNEAGLFDYKLLTNVSYRVGGANVGLIWRFLPSAENAATAISPNTTIAGTPSYSLFNLYGSYEIGRYTFRAGVDNLLDEEPLVVGPNPGSNGIGVDTNSDITNPSLYDPLGRRYYLGATVSF
jgi:iron complex outermembrane recepter protein